MGRSSAISKLQLIVCCDAYWYPPSSEAFPSLKLACYTQLGSEQCLGFFLLVLSLHSSEISIYL